jgi:long-chain acyl-CoA synthetase
LYQVLTAFRVGATLVLEKTFAYQAAILHRIVNERATGLPVVPTIAAMLLQLDLKAWDLSSLRYVTNAGAALPMEHLTKLRFCLPHAKVYCMYGLTECQRVSYLPPDEIDRKAGSVGKGMPNEEVYIVDENDRRARAGAVGELVVRGSHVMQGYWHLPEETARVLRPGRFPWERVLYSGDLFRADEDGYLYFVARKDDMIKTRGEKVSPKEVEEVLYKLHGIAEAAVVGVQDDLLGQAVKAVIVCVDGSSLSKAEVLRHCSRHLEDFMVPKIVEFRNALPKTANGKVLRLELGGNENGLPASRVSVVAGGVAQ